MSIIRLCKGTTLLAMPWQIFRFRPLDCWFWKNLENSQFYCNQIQNLNDPFDCKVHWQDSLARALASTSVSGERREALNTMMAAFVERDPLLDAGICCFSINMDNTLMWSHYADVHRGVCLKYDIPADYFSDKYQDSGSTDFYFVGGSQIYYGDDAFFDWLIDGNHKGPPTDDLLENAVYRIFCSKGKAWEHEEEWRLVTKTPGELQFEPEFLTQVTFGLQTSDADKMRLTNVAKRNNPNVLFLQAVRSRSSDFRIEYIDV